MTKFKSILKGSFKKEKENRMKKLEYCLHVYFNF